MRIGKAVLVAVLFALALQSMPAASAALPRLVPPRVPADEAGASIAGVSIETYGVTKPAIVSRYLSLRSGGRLTQDGVDRDFANLLRLAGMRPVLQILPAQPGSVELHWIVMSKWLASTSHPIYTDTPLSAPIQGVGFILTAPPADRNGGNFSAYTQLSKRANLARVLFTEPLHVDAERGTSSSLVVDGFGGRGVFRASEPKAINVYSWNLGAEALYLRQNTSGTQFEAGARESRSTDQYSSNIVATSLFNTSEHPARTLSLVAGMSHGCYVPAYRWRPPFCGGQYRVQVADAIGGLGATSEYRLVSADGVEYFDAGSSTIALHASIVRTSGILPDSFLLCAVARAYPKPFCGTDAQGATLEYRINESAHPKFEFVLFTEDAASRVRGAESFASPFFTWHPDTGVGVIYHGFRFDVAHGQAGNRLTYELQGQIY